MWYFWNFYHFRLCCEEILEKIEYNDSNANGTLDNKEYRIHIINTECCVNLNYNFRSKSFLSSMLPIITCAQAHQWFIYRTNLIGVCCIFEFISKENTSNYKISMQCILKRLPKQAFISLSCLRHFYRNVVMAQICPSSLNY